MTRPLTHVIALVLLAVGLGACSWHRLESNAAFRTLEPDTLVIGESTWRDVLDTLGPPSGSNTDTISSGLSSMATFRWSCANERRFQMILAAILYLPFTWGDEQAGYELVAEFDRRGVLSDLYAVTTDSVWRPFSEAAPRDVQFHGVRQEAP